MKYWGPINSTGGINGTDGYVDGNPATGTQGSIPSFSGFEQTLRELANMVADAGLTPSSTINGRQVGQAVQSGKLFYGAAAGTNTYTVTLAPVPASLPVGMEILVFFANANTLTNPTLNVNALGAAPVVKQTGGALVVGDLSGFVPLVRDSSGNWRFNGLPQSAAGRIIGIQAFTASGTYTPTTGMTFVDVQMVGGGGAGSGGTNPAAGNVSLGSPGGGATWSRGKFDASQIGASQVVTIGAAGTGSTGAGGSGGTTSLGSLITAPGGQGGLAASNVGVPRINGNGALSAAPTGANIAHQRGATPGYAQAVNALYDGLFCGPGGNTPFGVGTAQAPNSNGAAGTGYGSGGSGVALASGGGPANGGNGAPGYVLIIEYGS